MLPSFSAMALALGMTVSVCNAAPELPPAPPHDAAAAAPMRYKAVLVAGDGSLPVFDNAVDGVAARLRERGVVASGALQRLSAAPAVIARNGARPASLDYVLDAIRSMKPAAGEGCFVFATSHGAPIRGLALSWSGEMLSPAALDRALAAGCGSAPTVVIVSGCFSGNFTGAPMARANRTILAAARPDRASFGCGAGRAYTVYDRCLLDALDKGGNWQQAYGSIRQCVSSEEHNGGFQPSEPQAYFGSAVAGLRFPVAATTFPKHEPGLPAGHAANVSRASP